ncbi:MAG: response regulator [Candidatus Binatia bacterium]
MRVLIVEDNETLCQFLSEVLENKGTEAVSSTDGFDGYDKVRPIHTIFLSSMCVWRNTRQPRSFSFFAFADETLRETAPNLGTPLPSKSFSADNIESYTSQNIVSTREKEDQNYPEMDTKLITEPACDHQLEIS